MLEEEEEETKEAAGQTFLGGGKVVYGSCLYVLQDLSQTHRVHGVC